jgi:copper chaperone CopZ
MYCPKCEERIALALGHASGVVLIRADHVRGEVEIQIDDRGETALVEARHRIEAIGYQVEGTE